MTAGRAFRYARWDGTQEVEPFDSAALFDALAAQLLAGLDLESGIANAPCGDLTGNT